MVVLSSSFAAPVEGVLHETPLTKLLVNDQELGTATLYITEHNVVWGGGVSASGGASPTISLLYPTISLHAVQREPMSALYMVLNYELRLPELAQQDGDAQNEEDDDDDDFDADHQPITQLRFIPQNEADLNPMYSAMSQGQALHPDPIDEVDDEDSYMDGEEFDDGDEEFEDAEESNGAPDEAAARLRQLRLENSNGPHYEDCEDAEAAE
ncbi:methylosome subunit pICln [Pararge aegeria]|uniref:Jg4283 protein n=2 Tax=Pararge aegeria TaxID=116150 RepID=A0A8S4QS70_9NEOP|nr:methylosome subunit pICln [Pararge aegeria]CAH2217090.1 jg4283 [Pararge aegeria aegeria]